MSAMGRWERLRPALAGLLLLALTTMGAYLGGGVAVGASATYQHVFLIAEENHSYNEIVGSPSAPYINGTLIAHGALATKYFAVSHPSEPNYLALTSGSIWDNPPDNSPQQDSYPGPNIADEFQKAGIGWRAYMEDMASACDPNNTGNYDVNHNPFVYFTEITGNAAECGNDVPLTQMASDLSSAATTPAFAFISPNLNDDMHNGTIQQGDTWLSQHVPAIMTSPACKTSSCLVGVVWDEDDGSQNNQVAAIFYGSDVPQGYRSSSAYTHYSLLRTVENNFGLAAMTSNDANAAPMSDMLGSGAGPTATPTPTATATATPTPTPTPTPMHGNGHHHGKPPK